MPLFTTSLFDALGEEERYEDLQESLYWRGCVCYRNFCVRMWRRFEHVNSACPDPDRVRRRNGSRFYQDSEGYDSCRRAVAVDQHHGRSGELWPALELAVGARHLIQPWPLRHELRNSGDVDHRL